VYCTSQWPSGLACCPLLVSGCSVNRWKGVHENLDPARIHYRDDTRSRAPIGESIKNSCQELGKCAMNCLEISRGFQKRHGRALGKRVYENLGSARIYCRDDTRARAPPGENTKSSYQEFGKCAMDCLERSRSSWVIHRQGFFLRTRTRTRIYTNPYDTKTIAVGRSGCACGVQKVRAR